MKNETVTGYEMKNGMKVYNHGYIFEVSNVNIQKAHDGKEIVRFTGTLTDDERNDNLRHTCYNGGTYGQNADLTYTLAQ